MKQSADEMQSVLHQLMDLGMAMMANGAEVNRVEDTLNRLGRAYGARQTNVLVITSSIIITMIFPDGQELTQTRRILNPGGTDFTKLEKLNALSRECCARPLTAAQLGSRIQSICSDDMPRSVLWLSSILTAGSFTLFFDGNIPDALTAMFFAVIVCILQEKLAPLCPNRIVFNLLAAMVTGLGIGATVHLLPFLHGDKIMIGDIMLLIPGLAMTNSIRDMLVGDTISGIMRLIESLLWAAALAFGFMAAIWLTGG